MKIPRRRFIKQGALALGTFALGPVFWSREAWGAEADAKKLPSFLENAAAVTIQEFAVEPLSRYRLSFEATAAGGTESCWELRTLTREGLQPYEGRFDADWQMIVPGNKAYTHEFLTPRGTNSLQLLVRPNTAAPKIQNIKLDKITGNNLLINGDFSAGLGNYSGWNTRFLAELTENAGKGIALKCESGGYAVTDPVPVQAGSTYRFTAGSNPGRILIYDRDLLNIDLLFESGYSPKRNAEFVMPPEAAFIRVEYGDARKGRLPVINQVGIELVKAGSLQPEEKYFSYPGEIVLKPGSALPEVRAARELQHWIRKISGQEIQVLVESSSLKNTKFFIGRAWAADDFAQDIKMLEGSDGFAVRRKGDGIYIFGARPAGALFGAIRLLEDNSNLIFARPQGEFGTVYSKNHNLTFGQADILLRPAFVSRTNHSYVAESLDDGTWLGRVGMNTAPRITNNFRRREMGGVPLFDGNYMAVIERVPGFEFAETSKNHPEFYALVGGKRQIRPQGYICYTAPGIAEAIAKGLVSIVQECEKRGEKIEFLNIRTRDGWTVCNCENCMKPIPLPNGNLLKSKSPSAQKDPLFFSTRMTLMLNRVSEEFAKTYSGKFIGVPAYIYGSEPPAIPHAASLAPMFCAYDTDSIRFPILDGQHNDFSSGREWEQKFREYLKRTTAERKLSMFAYYYPNSFSTVADAAREDWLVMAQTGGPYSVLLDGLGKDEDDLNSWDFAAPEKWIMTRLMWNPALDSQQLREEYCKRAYQEAAPEMIAFYNLIHAAWSNPNIKAGVNCHTPGSDLFNTFIVGPGNEAKLRSLLVDAGKKAQHPHSKMLIQRTLAAFEQQAKSLDRTYIPYLEESTAEWSLPESTFWLQALKYEGFKKIATWKDFEKAPAEHPTAVFIMRDHENLYVRFVASKAQQNDRIELVLEAKRFANQYYFAQDRQGKLYGMKNWSSWQGSWKGEVYNEPDRYVAIFKIPFSTMEDLDVAAPPFDFQVKFGRQVSGKEKEESSLLGFALTRGHYNNYWTKLIVKD